MTPNRDIEEQIAEALDMLRSDDPNDHSFVHTASNVMSIIEQALDQQRQEIIEKVAVEKNNTHPWETDNHICKWCGANYTSAEIHATKHDYGS